MKKSAMFCRPILVLALFLLAACAGVTQRTLETRPIDEAISAVGIAEEPLPMAALDEDVLYDILLGEIASQRGQITVAAEVLSRAARQTRDPRLAERATIVALYAKRYDEALSAGQLWVELRPNNIDARESLAIVLLEMNRIDEAERALGQALAIERDRATLNQGYMRMAAALGRSTNRSAAVGIMKTLVQRNVDFAGAHVGLAHLAVRAGELEVASAAMDEALRLKPDWEDGALLKAQILISQKETQEVQKFYANFLSSYPNANSVRMHYARFLIDQKQWEAARDQFKRVVIDSPNDVDTIFAVGLLALQTNRMDEAETYLKRTLVLQPENDQARLYLGQVLENTKRYPEAMGSYEAITSDEFYFEAQIRVALIKAKRGDLAGARQHLYTIETESEAQQVQLTLAEEQMLRDNKQYTQAFGVLNAALKSLPDDKDLLYARALIAEKLDKLDLLESDLRAILKVDPKNVNALNALGYTFADRTDRYSEAYELLNQAIELKPDEPFVLDSMGWLQYRMGNNTEAIKYLKRALNIRNDAEIAAHLGEVLWVVGDRKEAESVWTRALRDTPDSEILLGVINKFREQRKE